MKVKFCLLDADYQTIDGKAEIKLSGVDESGKSVLVVDRSFRPYFYATPDRNAMHLLKKNKMVAGIERVVKRIGLKKTELAKIFVDLPQNVPAVRELIKKHSDCYEYSINFCRRYLIDKIFYPLDWLEVEGNEITESNRRYEVPKNLRFLESRRSEASPKISDFSRGFDVCISASSISKAHGKAPELKTLAFDLEVVDNKIVMASFAGHGLRKVITYKHAKNADVVKDEKALIEEFIKIIRDYDPDIIVGYNSDQFDFEVLRSRADEHKIKLALGRDGSAMKFERRAHSSTARVSGRVHIDLFQYVSNLMSQQLQSEVLTLNEVAKELVGEGKEELSLEDIIHYWNHDASRLAEYCLNDSLLTLKLSENIMAQIFELSKVCGQMPFDVCRSTFGLLSEWFLIRRAHEKNFIAPNNPHWDEMQKRRMQSYKGGYVQEPVQGLHDNIAVFDFRSLYPSVIATFNISPETLGKSGYRVPGYKHSFLRTPRGFVSGVVEELIKRRQEVKKKIEQASGHEKQEFIEHQHALKILANATYGMFGNPGARWYCRECAESAAAYGRHYIKKSIEAAKKYGFTALYSDTDSLFVKPQSDGARSASIALRNDKKSAHGFLEKINKSLPGMLELELQGVYKKGLFVPQKLGNYTAKKRYALIDMKGNLTIRGLETVRRDWCDAARRLQHDVIKLVLTGKEKEAVQLVKECVKKIKNRGIELRDITLRTQLGKPLAEYKAVGPHVAVARKLEKAGHDIREGMVISYIIAKPSSSKQSISDRAEPINKVDVDDYDVDYYLKNQIISVALRVLSVFGYREEDFLADGLKKFVKK